MLRLHSCVVLLLQGISLRGRGLWEVYRNTEDRRQWMAQVQRDTGPGACINAIRSLQSMALMHV